MCESQRKQCDTNHANTIPESTSDKIYNSIVKIKLNSGVKATGFLRK